MEKKIKVTLELNGPLKLPPSGRTVEGNFTPPVKASEVISALLGYAPGQSRFLLVTRGGESLGLDRDLEEDSTLRVFLRLGGG